MGLIDGVAFVGAAGHAGLELAARLAELAAGQGVPLEVVALGEPVHDLAAAVTLRLSRGFGDASVLHGLLAGYLDRHHPSAWLDDFRWRGWLAQAMGAAAVVCPDARADQADLLRPMGLIVLDADLPGADLPGPDALGTDLPGREMPDGDVRAAGLLERACAQLGLNPAGPAGSVATVAARALRLVAGGAVTSAYIEGLHDVGAAARDAAGRVWTGVNLRDDDGTEIACAEGVLLAAAAAGGAAPLTALTLVAHPDQATYGPAAPCPRCRSLLADLHPGAELSGVDALSRSSGAAPGDG